SGVIHKPEAKPFTFSMNRPYTFDVDTDIYQYLGTPLSVDMTLYPEPEPEKFTLPFFIDMTLSEAQNWANNNDVTLEINWVNGATENKIIWQSVAAGDHEDPINYILLEVETGIEDPLPEPEEPDVPNDDAEEPKPEPEPEPEPNTEEENGQSSEENPEETPYGNERI
ncbi:MAG TPA: hypothetical protein VKY25_03750, partial [Erysipelothrix sp.]|nr:hypothetical protein [Erysipelothrix sp.]